MTEQKPGAGWGAEFGREVVAATKGYIEKATAPLIARIEELERMLGEKPVKGMTPDSIEAIAKGFAPVVRDYTAKSQAPVLARLEALEKHQAGAVTGGVIDRGGHLILTLADGSQKDFGMVVGKNVDREDVARVIREEVTKIPAPRDGYGFEDLSCQLLDDERTLVLRFSRGEHVKEFPIILPTVLDRGVWKQGQSYKKNDGCTWGGSWWLALCDTTAKPDAGDGSWRLAVKRGAPGKDGTVTVKEPLPPVIRIGSALKQ